jgi:hypothetical protein
MGRYRTARHQVRPTYPSERARYRSRGPEPWSDYKQRHSPIKRNDEMGSEAFILGAGFSRAISDSMPLVKDLVEPLDGFLAHARGTMSATFPKIDNLELFLSTLAIPQPFLDQAENSYNQGLFFETRRWLAEFIFRRQQDALGEALPDWFGGLLRMWHERHSTVIALNYDTLVESAVMSMELKSPQVYRVMPQFTYANPVRFAASDWAATNNPYDHWQPTFTLCKLHGSLSWWRSSDPRQAPVDVEMWKDTFNGPHRADWNDVSNRVMLGAPLLVPPTLAKTEYLDNDLIRANWVRAHKGLQRASTIVTMGYSFPAGDSQTAALIGSAVRVNEGQQIIAVDIDRGVCRRIADVAMPRAGLVRFFGDTDQPITLWADKWARDPEEALN